MTEVERIGELETALTGAAGYLRSHQQPDGHWRAELEGDSILEAEYALLLYYLGLGAGARFEQLANHLRSEQQEEGGWGNFPGGPPVASVSVKAYFVLKLAGDDPEAPHMARARRVIRRLGGLEGCNSYTRLLLAIFGVYPWEKAPAIPPELILLPRWFYFNIYEMSSWSRAIVVPLSIIWATKPSCAVPEACRLDELQEDAEPIQPNGKSSTSRWLWGRFFTEVDRLIKGVEALGLTPLRERALERAELWVEERLEESDGLGAIFPSTMNTVIAFICRGRSLDDPLVQSQLDVLEGHEILEGKELRLQPCQSPVWDTALAMNALLAAGCPANDPALCRGAEWLIAKEVRQPGDWKFKNPDGEPGGWYFEYANEFYPDCDDTAEVLAVLARVRMGNAEADLRRREAIDRAVRWQLSMQSRNGGWAAFDKDCNRSVLEHVPFADHNAMLDPPTVDITGRTLSALAELGFDRDHPAVVKGLAFLFREQEEDGSWYGRWGSNYIYGTWLALGGLKSMGEPVDSEPVRRGAAWLLANQNEDGGWGESLSTYDDPSAKGQGPSTASQTSWAMMGLLSAGAIRTVEGRQALARGSDYLLRTQRDDGSWYDDQWTGTGFPGVFYLRYHYYACYFPLEALAGYRRALGAARDWRAA